MSNRFWASVGILVCSAELAVASPMTVPNYSFESPAVSDGSSQSIEGSPSGVNWTSTLFVQVDNPSGNGAGTTGMTWTTPVPDGDQVLHMTAAGNAYSVSADQKIATTFAAGQTYTVTVAVGNSFENDAPMHYGIRIFWMQGASSDYLMPIRTHLTDPVANGEWKDVTLSYTVKPTDSFLGNGFLDINLINGNGYDSTNGQDDIYFDNVRVDVSVPEPASLSFAGLGMLALMRRRKH
jgi:hypothetical protein